MLRSVESLLLGQAPDPPTKLTCIIALLNVST